MYIVYIAYFMYVKILLTTQCKLQMNMDDYSCQLDTNKTIAAKYE